MGAGACLSRSARPMHIPPMGKEQPISSGRSCQVLFTQITHILILRSQSAIATGVAIVRPLPINQSTDLQGRTTRADLDGRFAAGYENSERIGKQPKARPQSWYLTGRVFRAMVEQDLIRRLRYMPACQTWPAGPVPKIFRAVRSLPVLVVPSRRPCLVKETVQCLR